MTNKLKNKRGFSLVELMVVVAIMGTLASIAIPAFNEYRKSAKKASYRADLSSLHKGWLAFGVEIDSFCERDTIPQAVNMVEVGMESLRTSKLYGGRAGIAEVCSDTSHSTRMACEGAGETWFQTIPAGNGPGKHNFIGFGREGCTGTSLATAIDQVHVIQGEVGGTRTSLDSACTLEVDQYTMGVYGHVSGKDYFGISVNNDGVFSLETEAQTGASGDANCS